MGLWNNKTHGSEPWGQISAQLVSVLRDFTPLWVFFARNREDYSSTEVWEIALPWTSRLPKSAILVDCGGREWTRTIDLTDVNPVV